MTEVLTIARRELGIKEHAGAGANNPRIVEYHTATALKATIDEVAWCASFVNWCLREAGLLGTNSPRARSFLDWGTAIPFAEILPGDIVVFSRGNNPAQGHVGFFVEKTKRNTLRILGGNQSDAVTISEYSVSRIVGIRRYAKKTA